jgi:hypothetical protein
VSSDVTFGICVCKLSSEATDTISPYSDVLTSHGVLGVFTVLSGVSLAVEVTEVAVECTGSSFHLSGASPRAFTVIPLTPHAGSMLLNTRVH